MKWKVEYSKEAKKFIDEQDIWSEVRSGIRKFLHRMKGKYRPLSSIIYREW